MVLKMKCKENHCGTERGGCPAFFLAGCPPPAPGIKKTYKLYGSRQFFIYEELREE
jgi:hypothetical protein